MMERISLMAAVLQWLLLGTAVLVGLVPAAIGVVLLGVDSSVIAVNWGASSPSDIPRWLVAMGAALSCALLAYGLVRLSLMMRSVRVEGPFTAAAVGHLKEFARFWLLSLIVSGAWVMVARLINGALAGVPADLPMQVEMDGVISILVALCLFLVVRLLDEARRVAEEYGQIV